MIWKASPYVSEQRVTEQATLFVIIKQGIRPKVLPRPAVWTTYSNVLELKTAADDLTVFSSQWLVHLYAYSYAVSDRQTKQKPKNQKQQQQKKRGGGGFSYAGTLRISFYTLFGTQIF